MPISWPRCGRPATRRPASTPASSRSSSHHHPPARRPRHAHLRS